ncbi:epithelial cell adhesion molecule [Pogona vitticeps]|uniref:Epithelial cell adhesion molecule n=1 Tax=Pogona vitticeps TaxID=103695 RepID=A0A6J0TS83_9SAUR|nr:epithelial cell adhesion molecule [Pogona vitticeps]
MELPRGAALLLTALVVLAALVYSQDTCTCDKNRWIMDCVPYGNTCQCKSYGSDATVNCSTLTSKCVLMKAEMTRRSGRSWKKPETAYVDNDGIYNPECDRDGNFKAKQCNGTSTCWCVNSAGVRRTEKGDENLMCSEVVRTSWIILQMKHAERDAPFNKVNLERAIKNAFFKRYSLNENHIFVTYENPAIIIDLKQNATEKSDTDVDIADVAYYFEKDVKEDPLIVKDKLDINIGSEPLQLRDPIIYYVDEKAPEFSMKHLTAGVIAVIVVVVLAIVAGILVLIFTRRKRGKYEKAEIKELNEIPRERNA